MNKFKHIWSNLRSSFWFIPSLIVAVSIVFALSLIEADPAGGDRHNPASGGGFALMVEAVSLAGVIETHLVLVLGKRPGPAPLRAVSGVDGEQERANFPNWITKRCWVGCRSTNKG